MSASWVNYVTLKTEYEIDLMELDAKTRLDMVLNKDAITRDELNQFTSLMQVMNKNGAKMHDNSKFVGAVVGAKQLGFDPRFIAEVATQPIAQSPY